ncbi:MAG TPA: Holliday junction resolvase RuvX [Chloroflexota bacterium]
MAEAGGRLLGLDLGERRIGVALGDPTGLLASALEVLPSRGRARDVEAVREIAAREGAVAIVVGVPVNMDGSQGRQAEKSHRFGAALEAAGLPVVYWDERLTTVEAQRYLRDGGMSRQKRRETIDAAAAAILLQSYLDYRRNR